MAQESLVGQDLLIFEALRSHSDTTHSVGLFWMSGQNTQRTLPDNTKHSKEGATHVPAGFEPTHLCHSPRGHWDMPDELCMYTAVSKRFLTLSDT